jgi:GR25 family glycosyltransferase involved in LPS biosynthesis
MAVASATDKIQIHVISLDRTPDRFAEFVRTNDLPGLEIVKVPAVDGEAIDRGALIAQGIISEDLSFTPNSIACALSHMDCWRRAVDTDTNIIVCEDDAVFHRDFLRVRRSIESAVAKFDILYWGYNLDMHVAFHVPGFGDCVSMFNESDFADSNNIAAFRSAVFNLNVHRVKRIFGLLCYTITPNGARDLLSSYRPLRNKKTQFEIGLGFRRSHTASIESSGIDVHMGVCDMADRLAYAVVPPIVISPNDKSKSTIGGAKR